MKGKLGYSRDPFYKLSCRPSNFICNSVYNPDERVNEMMELKRFADSLTEDNKSLLEKFVSGSADESDLDQFREDFQETNIQDIFIIFQLAMDQMLLWC